MTIRTIALFATFILAGTAAMSAAEEDPAPPADPYQPICDSYGPGYRAIPGTSTCIKVSGSVQMDFVIGADNGDKSGGSGRPPGEGHRH